jgi:hypothetical protein
VAGTPFLCALHQAQIYGSSFRMGDWIHAFVQPEFRTFFILGRWCFPASALVPRQLHSRSLSSAERATGNSTETLQHQVNIAKVLLSRVPVPRSLLAANSPLSQEAGALNHYKPSIRSVFFSVAD